MNLTILQLCHIQVEQMYVTGRLIVKMLRQIDISHSRFF